MASVTFPAGVGGDGSTVTDDSSPTTGLGNGGHRTRFVPALSQVVAVAQNTVTQATNAASSATAAANSAASAVNSPGTTASSSSTITIGTGSKNLTIQAGKNFVIGQFVIVASTVDVTNYIGGQITAYDSMTGIMTVNAAVINGSGTFSAWIVALSGPQQSLASYATLTGAESLTNKTLASGTVLGAQVMGGDFSLTRTMFRDCGWDYNNAGDVAAIDYVNGHHQQWAPTGTKTLSITSWPPSGDLGELLIEGANLGNATITWPTIYWINPSGSTTTSISTYLVNIGRTLQTSGIDWVLLWSRDAGTTIYGKLM